jgi:hypothetical protein
VTLIERLAVVSIMLIVPATPGQRLDNLNNHRLQGDSK